MQAMAGETVRRPDAQGGVAEVSLSALKKRVLRPNRGVEETAECRKEHDGISANDWTPEYEETTVPARLRAICSSCPVWDDCLAEALRMNDIGYRASMTTKQRRHYFADIVRSVRPVTRHVSVPSHGRRYAEGDRTPTHVPGEGSLNTYRRGCRCDECRGHNAAARRRERARAS